MALQWISTAFLWSQWLTHDLANIFVYLPRDLSLELLIFSLVLMLLLHAAIFRLRGGAIQGIVDSKTNTTDIRSATIIDFIYAGVLVIFKEWSNVPMSTTWVFLGLLGGREVAISLCSGTRSLGQTGRVVALDLFKAAIGLIVSIGLALGLPSIHAALEKDVSALLEPEAAPAGDPPAPEAAKDDSLRTGAPR